MFIASMVGLVVIAIGLLVLNIIEGSETMTSEQLTKVSDNKRKEAVDISNKAKAENRDPTEKEAEEIDRLFSVSAEALALAQKAKIREDRTAKIEQARADLSKPRPRASQSNATVVPGAKPADGSDHQYAVSSDMHDNLLDDPKHGWDTFNSFAKAVKARFVSGEVDERLKIVAAAAGNSGETGEDGSFLTAPEFSDTIYERTIMALQILQDCDRITLVGRANMINLPYFVDHDRSGTTYRHAGVVAYRLAEGDDITLSKLKHESREIRINSVGALSAATQELLEDTRNFGERLMTKQGEALAEMMVEDVMLGDGVGKPLGAWATGSAVVTVDKEDDQLADSVTPKNILDMMDVLWPSSEPKAKWYYNRHLRSTLRLMTIPVGTGGEVSKMFERGRGGPDYLDNLPAQSTDHCAAPGDLNDIVLGDMSQYALVTKGNMNTAMSMHLYFASRQNAFRSDIRYGGAPLWKRAATPRKGKSGVNASPWVNLEAR